MRTPMLGLLSLLCILHNTLACSCRKPTVESEYCNRQDRFLIKARVVARVGPLLPCETVYDATYGNAVFHSNGYFRYKLSIEQIYRDIGSLNSSVDVMDALIADSLCGYEFTKGQSYILSGTETTDDSGKTVRSTGLCNLHDTNVENFTLPDCLNPISLRDASASLQERNVDPFLGIVELMAKKEKQATRSLPFKENGNLQQFKENENLQQFKENANLRRFKENGNLQQFKENENLQQFKENENLRRFKENENLQQFKETGNLQQFKENENLRRFKENENLQQFKENGNLQEFKENLRRFKENENLQQFKENGNLQEFKENLRRFKENENLQQFKENENLQQFKENGNLQ